MASELGPPPRAIERSAERGTRRDQLVSRAASWRARGAVAWPSRSSLRVLRVTSTPDQLEVALGSRR